jgi:ABC-type uncharacterized transport system substrate-binding protein
MVSGDLGTEMKRREFIGFVGSAATWPLAAYAQPAKLPIIGLLGASTSAAWSEWTAAFVQRLRELGWADGRNVNIEYRWAEGRGDRFGEIAAEFVRLNVDVIVSVGSAVPAIAQATSTIPIVFAIAVDPVGTGMVASLARPGGNVTGAGHVPLMNPITGIVDCCARATSGHATAPPPITLMKSRRLIVAPRGSIS